MPEKWTGLLIGKMHNHKITYEELAGEVGVTKAYISMILNGARNPSAARERLEKAVDTIVLRKEQQ